MTRRRYLSLDYDGPREVWPAFTDVMSTMALILFVLVLLAYVKNLTTAKHLDSLRQQTATSARELHETNERLRRASAELRISEDKRDGQDRIIADSNRQLGSLRDQLQSVAVLRVAVLSKLKDGILAEIGPAAPGGAELVTFADSGNIVINERLVFEFNSFALRQEAKPAVAALGKALRNLLADASIRDNIESVAIEGHADERGTASFNWDLSAKRATAVIDYMFQTNPELADSYGRYFAATARSKFRPINPGTTPEAYQQNRRIEISVIPRDANVRRVIDDYLRTIPATQPAPAPTR